MAYVTYSSSDTSTATTWQYWTTNGTNTSTTTDATWSTWANTASTTSTSTITTSNCWIIWTDQYGEEHRQAVNAGTVVINASYQAPAPETPEQRAERQRLYEEQRARRQEEERDYERQRAVAEATAEELLHSLLTDQQIADLRAHGHFFVIGSKSGKTYQIKKGYAGNVYLDEGGRKRKYCAHGRDSLPIFDHMVMQKLTLEHDEERFLQVANVS